MARSCLFEVIRIAPRVVVDLLTLLTDQVSNGPGRTERRLKPASSTGACRQTDGDATVVSPLTVREAETGIAADASAGADNKPRTATGAACRMDVGT